jgi:hypothetical protein
MLLDRFFKKVKARIGDTSKLDNIQLALGRIEKRQLDSLGYNNPIQWEFQVSSQWGEDGIIQFLVGKVPILNKIFIEFGVENYTEANTRFLLQNNYWSGLVIDGNEKSIEQIKKSDLYWRNNLKAHSAFIDKDNIDKIIGSNGISGDIGLLSVDIDGNDYWVWQAINSVQARIVVCEYNSLFGSSARVSIPYESTFNRNAPGRPVTYYGASIAALTFLAQKKGYELVAGNSAGNNIFFVKKEYLNGLKPITMEEVYVRPAFRESRNADGTLSFKGFDEARRELSEFTVVDVENNKEILIKDII